MPEYLSPGVYVEEIDRGPKPIEGVGTAMAAFVGFTEKAQLMRQVDGEFVTEDLLNKPQLVTNWSQFVERYGDFIEGGYLPHAVYGYFNNGGNRCYVISVRTIPSAQTALLNADGKPQLIVKAKQAGFDGLRLRVKVQGPQLPEPAPKRGAKAKEGEEKPEEAAPPAEAEPSFTINVERQTVTGSWQLKEVREATLAELEEEGVKRVHVAYKDDKAPQWIDIEVPEVAAPLAKLWPRDQEQSLNIETKLLASPTFKEFQGDVIERTGVEGLEALEDVTMLCVPDLMTPMPGETLDLDMIKAVQTAMIAHCEGRDRKSVV